jgi:hypothetical protein
MSICTGHHYQEEEGLIRFGLSGGYAKPIVDDRCLEDRPETEGGKPVKKRKNNEVRLMYKCAAFCSRVLEAT